MSSLGRRVYGPLAWSLAVLLVTSGVALLILMWTAVIGPFHFGLRSDAAAGSSFGLWIPGLDESVSWRVRAWRGIAPRDRPLFESASLAELAKQGVGSIAVPDARALTREQAVELRTFLDGGRGVILTGSVGVRGEGDAWQGYDLMARLIEVPEVTQVGRTISAAVEAARRGPLSAGFSPGEMVSLRPEGGVPAIDDPKAELRWAGGRGGALASGRAASKRLEVGRGRLVWLGPGPENTQRPGERAAMARLARGAILWASRQPLAEVLPWPDGSFFAGVVELDETGFAAGRFGETPAAVETAVAAEVEAAERRGELALVEIPVPELGAAEAERLKQHAIRALDGRGAWIATRGDVIAWKALRSGVSARIRRQGPNRLLLDVSNDSRTRAERVVVRVYLNQPAERVRVERTQLLQEVPELRFLRGKESLDLLLPELPPRTNRAYTIDFEPAAHSSST